MYSSLQSTKSICSHQNKYLSLIKKNGEKNGEKNAIHHFTVIISSINVFMFEDVKKG